MSEATPALFSTTLSKLFRDGVILFGDRHFGVETLDNRLVEMLFTFFKYTSRYTVRPAPSAAQNHAASFGLMVTS